MLNSLKKLGLILIGTIIDLRFAVAQNIPPIIPPGSGALKIPSNNSNKPEGQFIHDVFIPNLTKAILFGAGGIAVIFIIVAAVQMLTAYGNDEKIGNAKKSITYALVGLLICILAYAIVSIISSIKI